MDKYQLLLNMSSELGEKLRARAKELDMSISACARLCIAQNLNTVDNTTKPGRPAEESKERDTSDKLGSCIYCNDIATMKTGLKVAGEIAHIKCYEDAHYQLPLK